MYAVISTGGKQYKLNQGDTVDIERIDGEAGEKVTFDRVLCLGEEENIEIGTPLLEGARVSATIVEQIKGEKITIFKFKRRKMYRRKKGHRQQYTRVLIDTIEGSGAEKTAAKEAKAKGESTQAEASKKKAKPKTASKKTASRSSKKKAEKPQEE
jgi:large subunit ribosomal protein L21